MELPEVPLDIPPVAPLEVALEEVAPPGHSIAVFLYEPSAHLMVRAFPPLPVDPPTEVVGHPCETKVILSAQSAVVGFV